MAEPYDSTASIKEHIGRVQYYLQQSCGNLANRGGIHDLSKLGFEEKDAFDRGTPALKDLVYGSDEYKAAFAKYGMTDSVNHHYAHNPHHPEFYAINPDGTVEKEYLTNGGAIAQMSLFDLLEMVCDWKAASERHTTGDIGKSLLINIERFGIGEQLATVLYATMIELGFIEAGSIELPSPWRPEISCSVGWGSVSLPGVAIRDVIKFVSEDMRRQTDKAIHAFEERVESIPTGARVEGAVTIDWKKP